MDFKFFLDAGVPPLVPVGLPRTKRGLLLSPTFSPGWTLEPSLYQCSQCITAYE
jgi:hypothetical protein